MSTTSCQPVKPSAPNSARGGLTTTPPVARLSGPKTNIRAGREPVRQSPPRSSAN